MACLSLINLPDDALFLVAAYLSEKSLLSLWQSCHHLKNVYTTYIRRRRLRKHGQSIALGWASYPSQLVPSYSLQSYANDLPAGRYHLIYSLNIGSLSTSERTEDDPQKSFFVISQAVEIDFRGFCLIIYGGNLFYLNGGYLTTSDLGLICRTQGPINYVYADDKCNSQCRAKEIISSEVVSRGNYDSKAVNCIFAKNGYSMMGRVTIHLPFGPIGATGPRGTTGPCTGGPRGPVGLLDKSKPDKQQQRAQTRQQRSQMRNRRS
jgi:hypothetical protein